MLHRKNKNLRVVEENADPTESIINKIITELNSEDNSLGDIEDRVKEHKKKFRRRILIIALSVITIAVATFLLVHLQTYTDARVLDSYKNTGTAANNYVQFAEGVLKYSRDGIAYLNQKGEEVWNQSYQIKNPFVNVSEKSVAVADKGGNDIAIFQKEGLKGEIHTALPIEKVVVSEQGVVGAVLKNEASPKVICYDTAGNILVEHKSSMAGAGYPVDIALSADGEVLLVSYLFTQDGKITTKIMYYNFGEAGDEKPDHQVASNTYEDSIMPSAFFMDEKTSVIVGDNRLLIYEGLEEPKEQTNITIKKEIKSVFHNKKYIGLVLKNERKGGYELRLYSRTGRTVMSKDFTGDYSNVKISGSQVIMYDSKNCSIFTKTGIHKFKGELKNNILEIFPLMGINKYMVMNADGMEVVRFVK